MLPSFGFLILKFVVVAVYVDVCVTHLLTADVTSMWPHWQCCGSAYRWHKCYISCIYSSLLSCPMFYYLFMFLKYDVKIYNVKIVPSQRKCCFSSEQVVFSGVPIEEAWARSKVRQVLAPSRCQQAKVSLVSSMALLLRAERDPSMATPGIPPTECPFAPTLTSLSIRR